MQQHLRGKPWERRSSLLESPPKVEGRTRPRKPKDGKDLFFEVVMFVGSLSSSKPSGDVVPELCNRRTSLRPATAPSGLIPMPPFICNGVPPTPPIPLIAPRPIPLPNAMGKAPSSVPPKPPRHPPVEDDSVVVSVAVWGGGVNGTAPSPKISCATTSCAWSSD